MPWAVFVNASAHLFEFFGIFQQIVDVQEAVEHGLYRTG
jgi:hypothetical protein